ncbi:MAG: DUF1800 domain-containing protein [Pyrinomonadaceae bacterium]
MPTLKTRHVFRLPTVIFAISIFCFSGFAQIDPNPNSPEPVLLTKNTSARALASSDLRYRDPKELARSSDEAFIPGTKVVLYATNFAFMRGEGANSIRVYGEDEKGRQFRFPVLALEQSKSDNPVYAITILLQDEIGYWPTPENGDLLVHLTWRGLTSNKALLGYGDPGGWKGETNIVPAPLSSVSKKSNLLRRGRTSGFGSGNETEFVGYRWSGDRSRFIQQATFGQTPALDERIRRNGIRQYLTQQFNAAFPSANNPYPDIPLKNTDSQNATNGCGPAPNPTTDPYQICIRDHYTMYPIQTWHFREAFYGEPQLRHKIAWALSQIWVISGVSTQQSSWMIAYHKKLSENAFGNYRQLMKDITLNPGMGNYLDMMRSTKNNPNENYPREILQLFTTGLFLLNQDGTRQLDGQNNPLPTYTQTDINNFSKVFTGWRDCRTVSAACPNLLPGLVDYKDPMEFVPNNHDLTAKTLFSYPGSTTTNIPACPAPCTSATDRTTYANNSLDQTLDNIFYHPNTGPFVSKLLIQHLVTSDPTPAYVGRVAAKFNNNGQGVRGDMQAVIRQILLDPEARGDLKTDPNYGKLREPVQLMTNMMKTFDVKSFDLTQNSDGAVQNLATTLAQNPFNSPTVFNYYSAENVIPGTTLLGPEFGIMTTGTSIARANFANTMVYSQLSVTRDRPLGTKLDFSEMQAIMTADPSGNQLLDVLNQRMMHNRMSSAMRSAILPALAAITTGTNIPLARAQAAIYLVATSSQFQIQR